MIKFLSCDKDAYITNKAIRVGPNFVRATGSNLGYAGTLDLFKLYEETTSLGSGSASIELSRGLLHFDLTPLMALTASVLDINHSSFKCWLQLKNVQGGQTTPSNFWLSVFPLAKAFSEGVGADVVSFQHQDVANWMSASIDITGSVSSWVSGGANHGVSIGAEGDYYASGALSGVSASLACSQFFERGDEDMEVEVTSLISGTLSGQLPDYGFRVGYIPTQEIDSVTRFVKRFGVRHSKNPLLFPRLRVAYDDRISDTQLGLYFDKSGSIGFYRNVGDSVENFYLSGAEVTGSNCVRLDLVASKSITFYTTSWSSTHSSSINHLTTSVIYFSTSFSGSQVFLGDLAQDGIYQAPVFISFEEMETAGFSEEEQKFVPIWKSRDGATTFSSGSGVVFKRIGSERSEVSYNGPNGRFLFTMANLPSAIVSGQKLRLRVFIQDYNTETVPAKIPMVLTSRIKENIQWSVRDVYQNSAVIDYDSVATRLSSDGKGMYFDFYSDLPKNRVYEFVFKITENGKETIVVSDRFKVV